MAGIRKALKTAEAQAPTKIKAMKEKISPEVIRQIKKDKDKLIKENQIVRK